MRALVLLFASAFAAQANAQAMETSLAPERVAVTIYRDPDRGLQSFDPAWLNGYALISETRRIHLPAGESELRFEGVTAGLVPQTAIVTGLGEAVLEKNRDARLLSPGGLLDASLGQRLTLRRTNRSTGAVRVQDAIVRATAAGVLVQTQDGLEALRCTGLNETLLAGSVPAGLSAKPTLSVRVRSNVPVDREITLSYISNNFDWQADYVADLSADGRRMNLFGWITLANGDDTALTAAAAQAVAGKLNRDRVYIEPGESKPIAIACWPQGRTDQIPDGFPAGKGGEFIIITGSRINSLPAAPPPPPPPPPAMQAPKVMAAEERLGDVRLYRIPISVTVAARSQKQIAMLDRPAVKVEAVLRLRPPAGNFDSAFERVLWTRNNEANGLGLALPAGKLELFQAKNGRRLLIGESQTDDRAIGEKVEFVVGHATNVRARQTSFKDDRREVFALAVTNDGAAAQTIEVELPLTAHTLSGEKLFKRDGWMLWKAIVPKNGTRVLRYRVAI